MALLTYDRQAGCLRGWSVAQVGLWIVSRYLEGRIAGAAEVAA